MKTRYLVYAALWFFVAGVVLLYDSCYGPSINADQPQVAEINSNFTTAVAVNQYDDAGRESPQVMAQLEIELPEALMYNPSDTNWLFFSIQLPQGWTVNDMIHFTGSATGYFAWNDTLSQEMTTNYPPEEGYYWWVSKNIDPILVSTGTIEFSPIINTDSKIGTFWLDYTIGYDQNAGYYTLNYNSDYDNMIGVGLEDTVYVTSTGDNGPGSLREAIDIVSPTGYILFDLPVPSMINLSSAIDLYKDVNIIGTGKYHLNISTNFNDRVFNIGNAVNVTIKDLALVNSGNQNYYIDGGAIYGSYDAGILTLEDVIIQGCIADDGGAIYYRGAEIIMTDVDLLQNEADQAGAIYLNTMATMTSCLVSGNISDGNAGGIYASTPLVMDNVNIENNTSGSAGGGIYLYYSDCEILNSRIAQNHADYGGGIYLRYGETSFSNTNITENVANDEGGGIYYDYGNTTFDQVNRCNLCCNEAFMGFDLAGIPEDGTEIYVNKFSVMYPNDYWAFPYENFSLHIQSGVYSQYDMDLYVCCNTGDDENNGTSPTQPMKTIRHALAMLMTEQYDQHAIHLAPGTYAPATNEEVFPLYMRGYSSIQGDAAGGTIIDCEGDILISEMRDLSNIFIENLEVTNCSRAFQSFNSDVEVTNVSFTNPPSTYNDCILAQEGSYLDLNEVTIFGYDRAIIQNNSSLDIHDGLIADNWRGIESVSSSLYVYSSEVSNNISGGGIYSEQNSYTYIYDSWITGNSAESGGGVHCVDGSSLRLTSTTIKENVAQDMGGGILIDNSDINFYYSVNRSNLFNNVAPIGSDIASINNMYGYQYSVIVDTFTVLYPNTYYAYPFDTYIFDVRHGLETQYDQDLYVSPLGSDENTGTTPADPVKSITKAMKTIVSASGPHTIHLEGGIYSPGNTGESFPILCQDSVSLMGHPDSNTVIDADHDSYVLDLEGIKGATIANLDVTGGYNMSGGIWGGNAGGMRLVNSDIFLENVFITENQSHDGAGIYMQDSRLELEGCEITMNATYASGSGGGIYIDGNCELNTGNLLIKNNMSKYGGGIYIINSDMIIDSIELIDNSTSGGYGGGIYCENADVTINDITISGNDSRTGGGIAVLNCNPALQNLNIIDNTATATGGGVACEDASPLLHNVTIEDNKSYYGGSGLYIADESGPLIIESQIIGNSTLGTGNHEGGGVYCSYSQPVFIETDICGNTGGVSGGFYSENSMSVFTEVSISNNIAEENAGGVFLDAGSSSYFFECELHNNQSEGYGGALLLDNSSDAYISECSINDNKAINGGGICLLENSLVTFDPDDRSSIYFNDARGSGADLYSSDCEIVHVIVDTFTVISPTDYFAYQVDNFEFDILNYVLQQGNFDIYVSPEGSDDNTGYTVDDPLLTVNRALLKIIADTIPPHRIFLDEGVYSKTTTGELFPFTIRPDLEISGAGKGLTILDGQDSLRLFNAMSIDRFVLSDMSLTRGFATEGGGLYAENSHMEFNNVDVYECNAYRGGAMYFYGKCDIDLNNVSINNNLARYGAGIYSKGSSYITGHNASIENNTAQSTAGGIYFYSNNGVARNLRISGNEAKYGGGVYMSSSSTELFNLLIDNNQSVRGGGIYSISNSDPTVKSSAIVDNHADYLTGGIYSTYSSSISLENSIVWNNSLYQFRLGSCDLTVSHSDIMGGVDSIYISGSASLNWLEGNIDEDPLFEGAGEHPYALTQASPCIDAGITQTIPAQKIYPWDMVGNPRCADGNADDTIALDMGPYEFQGVMEDLMAGLTDDSYYGNDLGLQCFPNPVVDQGHITFEIPFEMEVFIQVFNSFGSTIDRLESAKLPAGKHRVEWNAEGLTPGVYIIKIIAGNKMAARKVVVSY